jgi:hypothetical protein
MTAVGPWWFVAAAAAVPVAVLVVELFVLVSVDENDEAFSFASLLSRWLSMNFRWLSWDRNQD